MGAQVTYYVRDYQGTIREVHVLPEGNAQVLQRLQYYPSGLRWKENIGLQEDQPYRYNGKEWVDAFGLDEYDSQARWYYPAIMRTTTMDPHAEEYPETSPYAWCANNPVRFVDEDGRDWYEDTIKTIRWTDYTSQRQMNDAGMVGTYLGEAVVVFKGYYDERLGRGDNLWGDGAKLATATVYGPDGCDDIATYDAFTMSSNYKEYGAIKDGNYSLDYRDKAGPMGSHWTINGRQAVDCVDNINYAWYKHKETYPYSATQKDKTYVHRSNRNGDMLPIGKDGKYHPVSTGCLIIAPSRIGKLGWNEFNNQLRGVQKAFLRLTRH